MAKKTKQMEVTTWHWRGPILGLDLSLTGTGWCISQLEGCLLPTPEWNVVETKGLGDFDRLDHILNKILALLTNKPLVILEDFSFASKGHAVFQIGGLGYLVRHALWKLGIPFLVVAPTLLKKFVAGKGNVDKNVILKEVFKRWQFDTDDDNIADAFVLMQIGRCLAGQLPAQNEVQVKIISELYKNIPGMLAGMHSNQQ